MLLLHLTSQMMGWHTPKRSPPSAPPLQPLICHRSWLLVDCCVFQWKGGNLRPEPGASLYFLIGLFLSPQTWEPSAAPPNLKVRALRGPIGSSGAMSWWHHWPTHGGRGPKPLEARAVAAHVGCCVLCCVVLCCVVLCCVVLCCVVCVGLSKCSYQTSSNMILAKSKWPTFACSYHKIGPQTPQIKLDVQTCHHSEMLHMFWLIGAKQCGCGPFYECAESDPKFS